MSEYITLLQAAILDEDNFVKATLSGQQHGETNRWQKCVIRPVLLKNGRHLQFSFFDQTQNITKNYADEEAAQQVVEVLTLPFRNFHVQTQNETIQVNLTKKGKAIVKRTEVEREISLQLAHDRPKNTILSEGDDVPFVALWEHRGLTANMGSGKETLIPIEVKPETAKEAVNSFETIRTPGDRF
jgi:hypothetical protein